MKYGLSDAQYEEIVAFVSSWPQVEQAILFGSRALGTFKEASDVDIALMGKEMTVPLAARMKSAIEEDTSLPFFFDFIAYDSITNEQLKQQIDEKGVVIFSRGVRGWRECRLGDFAEIQTGPFGSQLHAADYVEVGVPSIMPTNIGSRLDLQTDTIDCITQFDAKRLGKYLVKESDIVYSRRGDVEKCAFITNKQSGWLCGTGCLRVRVISNELFPKFCAYYLSTDDIKGWVSGNAVGTTMPNLNSSILQRLPLILPPLPEQKAIAAVLSSLDDKIDLLHRQNKTLEAMAETLFRQWFIEEAQEDWEEGTIEDVATNIRDAVKGEDIQKDGHYVGLEHIDRRNIALFNYGSGEQVTSNKYAFVNGDILFGKLRPYFHKVCFAPFAGVCSTDILVLRPKRPEYFTFCLFTFFQDLVVEYANLGSGGTRMPRTDWSTLKNYPIVIPDSVTLERFNKVTLPAINKIHQNIRQIRTLEKLRDTLLPKLMSCEVRVAA